jgi:ssDNA-binding replication factor A large subunit
MLTVEELVQEISDKSGKTEEEVNGLIKDKQIELSDLVSEEGAAYIVGRELGVELIKETKRNLKIGSILPEMRNVDVVARVQNIFEPREFEKNGKKGQVSSMILSDETGTIRLPLWNDEVGLVAAKEITPGDLVEVTGAWAKKDSYRDSSELRLGRRGQLKKLESGEAPETAAGEDTGPQRAPQEARRMQIADMSPGASAIVRGCLMQIYRKRPYFDVCPQCGKSVQEENGSYKCREHGTVQPTFSLLLSGVIDDGTANIRVVFFRDQAEKVFGRSANEVKEAFEKEGPEKFWEGFENLGKEFVVTGRTKISDFTKEQEMLANDVADVNAKEEAQSILKELGA